MEETIVSKDMIPKKSWDDYLLEQQEYNRLEKHHRDKKIKKENSISPRMPNGLISRWDLCNSYSNYDQMKWGPDPIDSVIDRLGIFTDINFFDDIKIADDNYSPTTWISRTGVTEHENSNSSHYQLPTVREFERNGLDAHKHEIFDSCTMGPVSQKISDYIGLDYNKAQQGARRDHGYALIHAQRPGQMATWHYDTYMNIMRSDPDLQFNTQKFRRFAIFLEDWRPGHVWNFGNTSFTHWKKGECITWDWMHMPHGTANLCMHTRYSLHLTGYMTESAWDFFNEGTPNTHYKWNNSLQTFEKFHNQADITPNGR